MNKNIRLAMLGMIETKGRIAVTLRDACNALRSQLLTFIEFLRTGQRQYPFDETIELMSVIIAGIRSHEQGGRVVRLVEVLSKP